MSSSLRLIAKKGKGEKAEEKGEEENWRKIREEF